MRVFKVCVCVGTVISALFTGSITNAGSLSVNDEVLRITNLSIRPWIQSSLVVGAIKRQNARHSSLSVEQVKILDQKWQDELAVGFGRQEILQSILSTPLSQFLAEKQDQSLGLISKLVVMDNKGLNVGISHPTTAYWQGNHDMWLSTYGAGLNRTFVSNITRPQGSRNYQITVSYSIADPATGKCIGAIAVDINVEKLIALTLAD